MTTHVLVRAAMIAALSLSAMGAFAQNTPSWVPPRTADGKPDFSGVYERTTLVWISGDEALARGPGAGRTGRLPGRKTTTPVSEPAPYRPEVLARVKQMTAADQPGARCLLPGVPGIYSQPFPMQIVQTSGQIIMLFEAFHAFRIIPTDGRKHSVDPDPTFMGEPVAHWEGDTLVIDSIGFNDKTWLAGPGGSIHSDRLHVTERLRLTEDGIDIEAIQDDPEVLTKPWTVHLHLNRAAAGTALGEYECAENNVDLPHLIGNERDPR
jgi:hypothetical protein